jgi:hypothetical protein
MASDLSKNPFTPAITTMQELQELEKETEKRVREIEKKIHSNESMYIQNTTLQNPQTSSMFGGFGNLMSGWEGLLEARSVDKKRATERIFSSSSESWLAHRRELDQKKKQENGGGGGDEVQTTVNGNKTNQYTADISSGVAEPPAPSVVSAAELAKIAELKALKKQKKLEKKARRALEQEAKNSHQGQGTTGTVDLQINNTTADGGSGGIGGGGGEKSEDDIGGGVERQGGQKRPREDDIFTDTNMDGTISNDIASSSSLSSAANAFDGLPSPSALMGPPMKKTVKSSKKG